MSIISFEKLHEKKEKHPLWIRISPHGGLFGSGGLFVKMGFGGGSLFGSGGLFDHLRYTYVLK